MLKRKLALYACLFIFLDGCATTTPEAKSAAGAVTGAGAESAALTKAESVPAAAGAAPAAGAGSAALTKAESVPAAAGSVSAAGAGSAALTKAESLPTAAGSVSAAGAGSAALTKAESVPTAAGSVSAAGAGSAALTKAESVPTAAGSVPGAEAGSAALTKAESVPAAAGAVPAAEAGSAALTKAESVPAAAGAVPAAEAGSAALTKAESVPAAAGAGAAALTKAESLPAPEPMVLASMTEPQPVVPPPSPDFLSLVAVGDNLFHDPMISPQKDGSFNYDSYYTEVKPIIQTADIAFVNQETVLAGKSFGYSGYPQFNTPQEVGLALIKAGFNIVNQATNHIMDKGEKAVFATMDFWDKHPEITILGIHRSQEERDKQVVIEKNNIKVGFLSYTYGTNGLPVPKNKPYLVSIIDSKVMAKEIDALRPNCDLLVVSMHWGEEYRHTPTAEQKRLAQFLADRQVDVIIGHHPHVLEGTVVLTGKNGNETFCVYSLGNFISNQTDSPTLLGGLLSLKIKKFEEIITIEDAKVIPLVTHYEPGSANFKVYPLYEYTEELAKKHTRRIQGKELGVKYFTNLAKTVLGDAMRNEDPFNEQ